MKLNSEKRNKIDPISILAIGTLIGAIIGLISNYTIAIEHIKYTAVSIIVLLDTIFGAIKAELSDDKYDSTIFITGLAINIILALGITLLGERLGLDLYLAVTVVFTLRIFSNLGVVRRAILKTLTRKKSSSVD